MRRFVFALCLATPLFTLACGSDQPANSPGNTGGAGSSNAGTGNGGSGNGGSTAQGGNGGNAGTAASGGSGANGGSGGSNPGQPGVVGINGIGAWDALSAGEKAIVTTNTSFFLHQSVGQDLEDGAEANGFPFEYSTSGATDLAQGLNGGLFSTSNGDPAGKIAEWRSMALANAGNGLRVAIMKFGYADIVEGKAAGAQTSYQAAVADIKAAGVRVLHVTPPFVYNVPAENAPKMATRTWMMETFKDDIIFDLEDVESTNPDDNSRCERGGSWEICDNVRSTGGCPSKSQGVDAPSGQGHICFDPHAQRLSKAFLYAIYLAAK